MRLGRRVEAAERGFECVCEGWLCVGLVYGHGITRRWLLGRADIEVCLVGDIGVLCWRCWCCRLGVFDLYILLAYRRCCRRRLRIHAVVGWEWWEFLVRLGETEAWNLKPGHCC